MTFLTLRSDVSYLQIIFKNDRQGLSPWAAVKFARDLLASLSVLHADGIVHADLKPANVLWSGQEEVFKCIDFGLSFSVEERDLHQVQSTGYRAPEAARWNDYKENVKMKRKRKLEGTFTQLNKVEVRGRESIKVNDDVIPQDANTQEIICDIYASKTKNDITDSNKKRYSQDTQLQHSDSHSSGIFSWENFEQSHGSQCEDEEGGDPYNKDAGLEVEVVIRNAKSACDPTLENLLCNKVSSSSFCNSQELQDWRVRRGRAPPQPGPPADMWSYGCLLAEVLTGRKLFQSGDKLAAVLRPEQLLEMKLGDTEAVWADMGHADVFKMLKVCPSCQFVQFYQLNHQDLIIRCIEEEPSDRLTADQAVHHQVFQNKLSLSADSCLLSPLPTATLRFTPAEPPSEPEPDSEMLQTIKEECQTYGEITDCKELFSQRTYNVPTIFVFKFDFYLSHSCVV